VRLFSLLLITAMCLCLAATAFAQDDTSPDDQSAPPPEEQAPTGPSLQATDNSPIVCDPDQSGFRYDEIRGTGFDAFVGQHLVGSLVANTNGAPQASWNSVWVSPQGTLTLEVNLCADPFLHRGALPTGDYTVAVGQGSGSAIAATAFSVSPPPDTSEEQPAVAPSLAVTPEPTSTPFTYTIPKIQAQPTPTPLPIPGLPGTTTAGTTPTPVPSNGLGSQQQPYPPGAPGNLVDGWQLIITGVSPDAFKGIQDTYPSAIAPASDQRDYEVRIQATFLGQGTGAFSGVRLALLSTRTGQTYDEIANSCGIVPDMVPPNVVTQGQGTRGNVCFVVRAADVGWLIAYDNQPNQSDRVYFSLQ
jgi:hypothetical protein